ncbi:acid phosphatase (class A) [Rhizomicrobium palustre]|uniref:Acid phosphatase (Class A) n=1 Tax=Rhizomicrobium palustre TaxID=189966 RepID=A0A846MZP3_9PROT|nr:phosphatase PAP2 family protein [Rhizomicrobium palustre]NIK88571.1 acid phosphatase (class A) [Rhizomicrobium palustre]
MRIYACLAAMAFAAIPAFASDQLLLTPDAPARMLPAPPPDGSAEQKREMAELLRLQKTTSATAYEKADKDDKTESVTAFAEILGPWFDMKALPKTAALFQQVRTEEKAAAKTAKTYFLRNRPWVLEPSLKTCTRDDPQQSSYPSGHATLGYSFAVVLAHLLPDDATKIMARAKEYAENRLVCGVHYRSDIVAGQVLGTVVSEELLANANFKAEFEAAQAELTAAKSH